MTELIATSMRVAAIEHAFPSISHPSQTIQSFLPRKVRHGGQMGERTERIMLGIEAAQQGETRIEGGGGARKTAEGRTGCR
jgi:hypothetical protein